MSVALYDEALVDKINSWITTGSKLRVIGPNRVDETLKRLIDENHDKPLELPIIILTRDPDITLSYTNKRPLSFDGKMFEATKTYSYQLNGIPMTLKYQLDIYTRTAEEGSEYLRNFVFNFVNSPPLKIELPYNQSHREHISNVILDSNITDNSDMKERLFGDQFTRWTLGLTISDAYMFSIPKYDNVYPEVLELDLVEPSGDYVSEKITDLKISEK